MSPPVRATVNMPALPNPASIISELAEPMQGMMQPQAVDIAIFILYFGIGSIGAFFSALTVVAAHKMSEVK